MECEHTKCQKMSDRIKCLECGFELIPFPKKSHKEMITKYSHQIADEIIPKILAFYTCNGRWPLMEFSHDGVSVLVDLT